MPEQIYLGSKPMNEFLFEIQTPRGIVNAILKTQESCDLEGIFEGELSATLEGAHSLKFKQKGLFVIDTSEGRRPILLKGSFETFSMDSQLLSSGHGTYKYNKELVSLNLDSDALGLDIPTHCVLRIFEKGHCTSTQTGLFTDGNMQSGLLLQTPNGDTSKGRVAYRGKFNTGEEKNQNSACNVMAQFDELDGEHYVWREDGCIEIKIGVLNGKPRSGLQYCARLKEKQLDSLVASSFYYPGNALWTCTRHAFNDYSIATISANELDKEYVLAMFLEIEQTLVEFEYAAVVHDLEVMAQTPPTVLVTSTAVTELKRPVVFFDGTVWELIQGSLDKQGCLQGHAIVQQHQENDVVATVDGNFLNHHFTRGTIEYVCSNISRQSFSGTCTQNKLLGTLTTLLFNKHEKTEHTGEFVCGASFNIQHMKGIQSGVVRKIYGLKQNIDANTRLIWQLIRQYEGVVIDGVIYERGMLTEKTYLPDQVKTKKIMSTFSDPVFQIGDQVENETVQSDRIVNSTFIYSEQCDKKSARYRGRKNIATTYTDGQPSFNVAQVGLFGIIDNLREYLIQGTYQFRHAEESNVFVIEEGLFTPEGVLDNHHHPKTTCERKIFYNDNLSTHMEGTFAKGRFLVGKCTKTTLTNDGDASTIISWGKWRDSSKAVRNDFDYELHDPNGISYQINEKTQQGIRYYGYQDGRCSEASFSYIFVYRNKQLVILTEWASLGAKATEHWTLIRNSDGELEYQKAISSTKKKDKAQQQLDEVQAVDRFNLIEAELVDLKVVESPQPSETLEDLARQEEAEKKAYKSKKANDKKYAEAEKKRKELEHQPKSPEVINKKKQEKKEIAKKEQERKQSSDDVLLSVEKDDEDIESTAPVIVSPEEGRCERSEEIHGFEVWSSGLLYTARNDEGGETMTETSSTLSNHLRTAPLAQMRPSPEINMMLEYQQNIRQWLSLEEELLCAKTDVDEMLKDALASSPSKSELQASVKLSNANIPPYSLVVGHELTTESRQKNGASVSHNPYRFYFYDVGLQVQSPIHRPPTPL